MSEEFIAKIKENYHPPKNYFLKTEIPKTDNNQNTQQYFDNKRKMKRGGPKRTWRGI